VPALVGGVNGLAETRRPYRCPSRGRGCTFCVMHPTLPAVTGVGGNRPGEGLPQGCDRLRPDSRARIPCVWRLRGVARWERLSGRRGGKAMTCFLLNVIGFWKQVASSTPFCQGAMSHCDLLTGLLQNRPRPRRRPRSRWGHDKFIGGSWSAATAVNGFR
jgi:hypothetical protein